MKTLLWAILGLSLAIVSCVGSKSEPALQYEEIAQLSEKEDPLPLKRHDRW